MDWFLVVARALHFAACASLGGLFAFECLVAGPALCGAGAGFADAAGLRRRLRWLAWASLALALVSGAAWLVAIAADMSGKPLGAALSSGTVAIVLTHTRIGEVWLLRLAVALLLGLCLFVRNSRRARGSRTFAWAAFGLSSLVLVTLAWAGHGAADEGIDGYVHLAADLLHLLAAGTWLGTLVPFALLLAAARRGGDPAAVAVARMATRRFSVLAVVSVGVLIASGIVNTWYLSGSGPALLGTPYGRLLLAKIALFIAMLLLAAVNLLRLTPRLNDSAASRRVIAELQRNAVIETGIGLGILAIVGALGITPPGLHTEPRWPLPFRIDLNELSARSEIVLLVATILFCACGVIIVAALIAGRRRMLGGSVVGLILCIAFGGAPLLAAIEPAYPTSFYAPTVPYDAAAVVRGAAVYSQNCAICHGVSGRGDGPAAASLPVQPANLTEPHLFAHNVGDLFWWVTHGFAGVMPGFDGVLTPTDRWNVIHFVRARAAGILARDVGPEVTSEAAPQVLDFAFETDGVQGTLSGVLKTGPALLVLCGPDVPMARLKELTAARPRLAAAGLQAIIVGLGASSEKSPEEAAAKLPEFVDVSANVIATLQLFRSANDGGETELMLDRNGNIRARWTAAGPGGLAPPDELVADAKRVAAFGVAAQSHAGHGG